MTRITNRLSVCRAAEAWPVWRDQPEPPSCMETVWGLQENCPLCLSLQLAAAPQHVLMIIIPVLNVWSSMWCVTTLLFLSAFCDLFSVLAQSEATNPSYSLKSGARSSKLAWYDVISTEDLTWPEDNWTSEVFGTQQCFIVVSVKHLQGTSSGTAVRFPSSQAAVVVNNSSQLLE